MNITLYSEILKGKDHLAYLGIDGDNIKVDVEEIGCVCGLDSTGSGCDPLTYSSEHGNEPSDSIGL
jgi:hypothetical protein